MCVGGDLFVWECVLGVDDVWLSSQVELADRQWAGGHVPCC